MIQVFSLPAALSSGEGSDYEDYDERDIDAYTGYPYSAGGGSSTGPQLGVDE